MTSKTEIIEKIRKVQALADRGVDGEKENAARMVERLMTEHDITEEELRDDIMERRWFRYNSKDKFAPKLMSQVMYATVGSRDKWSRGRKAMTGMECTAAEEIEIRARFEFYYKSYQEDLDAFFLAFISKNDIFPTPELVEDDEDDEPCERTVEEQARIDKASNMMRGMEKHDYHKQIGGK